VGHDDFTRFSDGHRSAALYDLDDDVFRGEVHIPGRTLMGNETRFAAAVTIDDRGAVKRSDRLAMVGIAYLARDENRLKGARIYSPPARTGVFGE